MSADRITQVSTGSVRHRSRLVGLVGLLVATISCGADDDATVVVFGAASLADVLGSAAESFTETTGVEVRLNIAGSSALRLQLDEGADADVYIPADPRQLELLVTTPEASTAIAANELVVAHPVDGVPVDLGDFENETLLLGACAPQVPCGRYAAAAFHAAGIDPQLDTEEPDVRSVATKVADGDLDAGIVYATDVAADPRLAASAMPDIVDEALTIVYVAAEISDASNPELARQFIDFLVDDEARRIFDDAGFAAP